MNITRRDAVKLGAGVFGTASALGLAAAQKVNQQVKGSYNFEAGFTDASFGTKICEQWIAATSLDVMWGDAQPSVVTSTVTDWMFGEAIDQVEAGEFGDGKVIEANIDNGGVYLGSFSSKVPEDVQKKIGEYTEQVKAGTLISDADVDAIKATL